jgi:hypothetical protein
VLIPVVLVLLGVVAIYMIMFYAWLSATPSAQGWHRTAVGWLCAAVPLCVIGAGLSIWLLRPCKSVANTCPACGYSLAGLDGSSLCPECGRRSTQMNADRKENERQQSGHG